MAANPIAPPASETAVPVSTHPISRKYTYADFLALPDDGMRYEIIEGVLYMANAPSYEHQFIISELMFALQSFIKAKQWGVVLPAPFEVHLSEDTRPVQPDLLFIAADRQLKAGAKFFEGAPDLIVEVISPSSLRVDRVIKFNTYERAGVKEYWIADPKTHVIEVHVLTKIETGATEYVLLGSFGPGEALQSAVLPGLVLAIAPLFAPA